jgi:hypothetical protein
MNMKKHYHKKSKKKKRNERRPKRETIQLFDLMFKFILQEASGLAIIHLLNTLFRKNLPLDTPVSFGHNENVEDQEKRLAKRQSDIILRAGKRGFLTEIQSGDDLNIALRVFEYAFAYARKQKPPDEGGAVITFSLPEALIIHLEHTAKTPDTATLRIELSDGTPFEYTAPVFKLSNFSLEELEAQRLYLLFPFHIVEYRDAASNKEDRKEVAAQVALAINKSEEMLDRACDEGVITDGDAVMIMERIAHMYVELYGTYEEFREEHMKLKERLRTRWRDYREEGRLEGREEGRLEGIQEGVQQGLQQGVQQGVQQGLQQGVQQGEQKVINLLRQGYTLEQIEKLVAQENVGVDI